jgi:hypothetical protein
MERDEDDSAADGRKKAAQPLTARASIDARIKPSTASNAERLERKRLSPRRTIMSVAICREG